MQRNNKSYTVRDSKLRRNRANEKSSNKVQSYSKKTAQHSEKLRSFQQNKKNVQTKTRSEQAGVKNGNSDTGKLSKGVLKRYAGSQISGVLDSADDLTNYLSKVMPGGGALKAGTEAAKFVYDNTAGKANENISTKSIQKKLEKTGNKLQKSGQKDIDKVKEDKSGAAQWGIDLATGAAELGLDAILTRGRGTMAAMYNRAYGSAKQSALDEGASEEQARMYGRAIGGLEAATEKMFSAAKPLQKLYGKGAADDVMEALLQKVVSKTTSKTGKNVAYHGGKTLASAITEGLEEMVSEGLDPVIANQVYANAIGNPHEMADVKDYLYSGSIGAALGGTLGGAGQIMEYGQGRHIENIFGDDGIKSLAKAASQVDEAGEAVKGAAINEMINQGKGIASGQAGELYKAVYSQEVKDLERESLIGRSADAIMQRENLISPIQVDEETGEIIVGRNTVQAFNEQKEVASAAVNQLAAETDMQLPEMTTKQIAEAVAAIQTGIGGIDEVNLFTVGNPEARTVYEIVTGKTLPKTNKETREMLFEEIGKNRVNSARLETNGMVDSIKGLIIQDASLQYEQAGQEAFAQAFSDVNVGNVVQISESLETFDDFYRAGRNDIAYEDVISVANPAYENVSREVREAAWKAGQQDRLYAADVARNLQIKIGQTARNNRSQGIRSQGGRLISEISRENRSRLTASRQGMLRMLARVFGIDIHLVDSLSSGANGEYHDGAIYLSMENDRALEYIFAHEITHHMQSYAPEEYNKLKELIRSRWAQRGDMEDAIKTKMAQYARHDVKISHEEALDEIIADSTYEVLQDEEFIDEVVKTDRGIAQAILDAIKSVLRKLRLVIAGGDRFTPAQNEALLSELDLLKEFERLWADGLMRAAENRAAVGNINNTVEVRQSRKDGDSLRDQLRKNLSKLEDMEPVADVKYESIRHLNRAEKAKVIMKEYDKKFKGGIERENFGFIMLRQDEVVGSLKYLHTDGEYAAFNVLPQVLKRGRIISGNKNHKGRAIDTVTIAAPVTINETTGYMAAAVKVGGKNRYHVHRILMPDGSEFVFKEKTEPISAGVPAQKNSKGSAIGSASNNNITDNSEKNKGQMSLPDTDSEGNSLTDAQREYFRDSKIVDEEGKLRIVYHGSSEDFTIFDRARTRANMDIQGNFFSPWEIDAGGYGENVRAFYLNIKNPAPEGVAYQALNRYKGQNEAGVKAREYLVSQGYDGVNNSDEEYIAFYPEQIKNIDNENPTDSSDIRYSLKDYDKKQIKNWGNSKKIIIYENPQQLKSFVDEARQGKAGNKKIYFGVVPDDLAKRVLNETGIDISNRNVALGAYEIQKILKDHGDEDKEATRGQRAITADDFSHIRDVIESPDTIELDDKLYNGRPIIKFTKVIGSKNTVVTYDSVRSSDLRVQTMYIGQNKKSLATVIDEQASINTPEATSGTALKSSITDDGSKSNTQYSYPDESDVVDYANEYDTEFIDVPPVRDYEKDALRVRQQTYGELLEQVEKLKRDKHLTKGKVLDEKSVSDGRSAEIWKMQ